MKGHSDIVEIIMQQPKIEYKLRTFRGDGLVQAAVWGGNVKCVETLAAQERVAYYNDNFFNF